MSYTYDLHNKHEIVTLIKSSFKKLHPNDKFVEPMHFNDTKTWNAKAKRYDDWGHSFKYWGANSKYNNIWEDVEKKGKKLRLKIELAGDRRYIDKNNRPLVRSVPAVSRGVRIYA